MDPRRKRYLIASALFEYVNSEAGKPLELRRDSDAEDMQHLLDTEYSDLVGMLADRKAKGHRKLAGAVAIINDKNEDPAA
jgi:hypothetical protein